MRIRINSLVSDVIFFQKVEQYFEYLVSEFDYEILKKVVNGNMYYDIQYKNSKNIVSISYENIEDYLLLVISLLDSEGVYSTEHNHCTFSRLREAVYGIVEKNEINANNKRFKDYNPANKLDRELLKSAKDLRIILKNWDKIYSVMYQKC